MVKLERKMSQRYLTTYSFKSSFCFYIVRVLIHDSFLNRDDIRGP